MDLKKFIVPKKLDNTSNGCDDVWGSRINTTDLVYIDNSEDVGSSMEERICYPTDYAIMNGAVLDDEKNEKENRKACYTWLRSSFPEGIEYVDTDGYIDETGVFRRCFSLRPALQLNLASVILAKKSSRDIFKIGEYVVDGKVKYHTIEFGEYPKTYIGNQFKNKNLEKAMLKGSLKLTGKKYTGYFDNDNSPTYNNEYMFDGQKYVRVLSKSFDEDSEFLDSTKAPEDGTPLWVKVEPITWNIRNWDDMPKEINPKGSGKATTMDIQTVEGIISGIPYYPYPDHKYGMLWQNSSIRGYLNGYNVNNIKTNGDPEFSAPDGGDFSEHNFLAEAFDNVFTLTNKTSKKEITKKKERKGYGVKVLDRPMAINEQIKFYIDNGKSFMLHGPSGVGKTRRIEEADPDFVSIVLRNGILPEEVIGKTIYPNNDKTKAGIWVPPAWYVDLCDKCEHEPNKQHVLFIDEITNVKPSEQSLVFHLVLNNSIGPNVGKLPKNVVVVAAGNSKDESEAAYNMPEPLFRRFDAHIELKPDVDLWLEWGSEQSEKNSGRLKVHPLVANFVATYGDKVFYSPYDSENPPKYAIDPRGWEQISDIIYDNNGIIAKELIENKVGKEITATFIAFAKNPPLMLEDIIESNYDHNDIPVQFDAKYALALSLRYAKMEEIQQVREFIHDELGAEILSMFDVAWVGNDNEKAIYLDSLPKIKSKKDELEERDLYC